MNSRILILLLLLVLLSVVIGIKGDCVATGGEQMVGPGNAAKFPAWIQSLRTYRQQAIQQLGLNDSYYDLPQLQWTQTSFIQPQMMVHERFFYDPVSRQYTVKNYLNDLNERYGGIDSVLIWPTYTNIGTDDRNQFDLLRSMPLYSQGGVKQMIIDFHNSGVKVLFPYNPWDQGTRYEGQSDDVAIAQLWNQIGADGFNGDTMGDIDQSFFAASYKLGHPIALEAENENYPSNHLNWQVMGWGYWTYQTIPCVSTFKWLIPKHLTNVCNRWAQNHVDDLQYAFFNGVGFESWENVWGIWNQIVPRDAEALRRIATILRFFGKQMSTPNWIPHTTDILQAHGSAFPDDMGTLYTIVNRDSHNLTGVQMSMPVVYGTRYFDVYHGIELTPQDSGATVLLSFEIESYGYGAVYTTNHTLSAAFTNFLQNMRSLSAHPLSYYSDTWTYLTQQMVTINPTPPVDSTPSGMVLIPSTTFDFVVNGIEIEGGNTPGVDFQYPWETYPQRQHVHSIDINNFYIDIYPVTNAQYKNFLDRTNYKPADSYNFLRDWNNGTYPSGWDKKPVVWVGLEEARDYCAKRNPPARLPNEWEWQYAAQGTDGRLYPWGNTWDTSRVPIPNKERSMRGPDNVDAHPTGASVFGINDLTGNVYQWTNEFRDPHTRAASIRGGNYYQPQGSMWYQPQSYQLNQHTKYLLMDPTMDRSGGIGFRCVVDAPNAPPPPCKSAICGSVESPDPVVNLSQLGTKDWKHWGLESVNDVNRKATGGNIITSTIIGTSTPLLYTNDPTTYSWTDGVPTRNVTQTPTGIYVAGVGHGFKITVPAQTTRQKLQLYFGLYSSSGTVTVTLSSTPGTYTKTVNDPGTGIMNVCFVIDFAASSAGETLTVAWEQTSGDGNVTLQSVTLS